MTLYQLENHVANRNQQNCSAKVKENAVQYIQSTIKTDIEEERDTKEIIKYSKVFVKFMCAYCHHAGLNNRGLSAQGMFLHLNYVCKEKVDLETRQDYEKTMKKPTKTELLPRKKEK